MVGLIGLQERRAALFGAPGAARHLPDQLERPLRRPQVRALQPKVGVNHPNQRQQGKVVPLGHDLGADDDVGGALGDLGDLFLQGPRRGEEVRRQHRQPRLGKPRRHLFGQPLHPRPDRSHPPCHAATGTNYRDRLGRPALMADEALQKPMLHHPRIAIVAADLMAACPADGDRRIAATVEEQKALLALQGPRRNRLRQGFRDVAVAGQLLLPHVNRPHRGQFRHAVARPKVDPRIFPRLRIGPAFQTWRGRGQDHRAAEDRRPQNGHVAGVVENALLLLVGGVMLFIDHDQAKVAERQEQRRPRAHNHLHTALGAHLPKAAAFGGGHAGMPLPRSGAKALLDAGEEISGQGNLGQQDQRLLPTAQRGRHGLQINLGLARAGDAFQQGRGIAAFRDSGIQRSPCANLIPRQPRRSRRIKHRIGQIARRLFLGQHARLDQPLDDRGADIGQFRQFAQRHRRGTHPAQRLDHLVPRLGQAVRDGTGKAVCALHGGRQTQSRRTGGKPQHRGQGRQSVIGGAGQKRPHLGPHRRRQQHLVRRP